MPVPAVAIRAVVVSSDETRLYAALPELVVPLPVRKIPTAADEEPMPDSGRVEADFVLAERVGFFHHPTEAEGPLKAGDRVAAGQVLGIIDSLSVPIPLQAARAGRVEEVLVEDGQPVEFGQPLFVLRPETG